MGLQIDAIQVFGERNSGTNYLDKLIHSNFANMPLAYNFFGWKHGDIGQIEKYYEEDGKLLESLPWKETHPATNKTLFIVIFRNPLVWLQSMHRSPHAAPKHYFNSFDEFIEKKWQCYYSKVGQPNNPDREYALECAIPENLFEEEDNILALRTKKINLHLSFRQRLPHVCFVNYEQLAANPEKMLRKIATVYDIKMHKNFKNITEDKFGGAEYKPKKYAPISVNNFRKIIKGIDWRTEAKIGYKLSMPLAERLNFLLGVDNGDELYIDPEQHIRYSFRPTFIKYSKVQ